MSDMPSYLLLLLLTGLYLLLELAAIVAAIEVLLKARTPQRSLDHAVG